MPTEKLPPLPEYAVGFDPAYPNSDHTVFCEYKDGKFVSAYLRRPLQPQLLECEHIGADTQPPNGGSFIVWQWECSSYLLRPKRTVAEVLAERARKQ